MGLFTEVKMGNEGVLGEMDRQVAQKHVERRLATASPRLRGHFDQCHREHETGPERHEGLDDGETAPLVAHHGQGTDDIRRRGNQREIKCVHASFRAWVSRASRVF